MTGLLRHLPVETNTAEHVVPIQAFQGCQTGCRVPHQDLHGCSMVPAVPTFKDQQWGRSPNQKGSVIHRNKWCHILSANIGWCWMPVQYQKDQKSKLIILIICQDLVMTTEFQTCTWATGCPKLHQKNVHHKYCLRCWHLYPFLVECWISKPMCTVPSQEWAFSSKLAAAQAWLF